MVCRYVNRNLPLLQRLRDHAKAGIRNLLLIWSLCLVRNERSLDFQKFPESRVHGPVSRLPLLERPARGVKGCCTPILRSRDAEGLTGLHSLSDPFNLIRCGVHAPPSK